MIGSGMVRIIAVVAEAIPAITPALVEAYVAIMEAVLIELFVNGALYRILIAVAKAYAMVLYGTFVIALKEIVRRIMNPDGRWRGDAERRDWGLRRAFQRDERRTDATATTRSATVNNNTIVNVNTTVSRAMNAADDVADSIADKVDRILAKRTRDNRSMLARALRN